MVREFLKTLEDLAISNSEEQILSVTELNDSIKFLLEGADFLQNLRVKGEISNFNAHRSGHLYFSLKDKDSQVSCVMFKWMAQYLRFEPEEGMEVVALGNVGVYSPRGSYQIVVTSLKQEGQGDLYQRFLELKENLQKEGLFDSKADIPYIPERTGIITSPTGSVIRDIISTLYRRFRPARLLLFPSNVQGKEAVPGLIEGLRVLDNRKDVELIILARGGGSIEDLWCFNDEALARAIFACKTPVISAIGHETDFTISDFVADFRAETPTAAAQMAYPDAYDLDESLRFMLTDLRRNLAASVELLSQKLDDLSVHLDQGIGQVIRKKLHDVELLEALLNAVDVHELLQKGFSITTSSSGTRLKSIREVERGENIVTILEDGRLDSSVLDKKTR